MCKGGRMDKQQLLNELYSKYWDDIKELRNRYPELSAPILIKIPTRYLSQKVKLMIIGQQTQGWGEGNINDLLECYEDFNFGENYHPSPFWNVTRKLEVALGIEKYAIVWSNLNRCDYEDKRPPLKIEKDLRILFPLLLGEIKILQPDVVIFFSGPNFDEHIRHLFIDSRFESVDTFTIKELSRINHELLPQHTYRTYHPKYLRISGIEPRFIEYIENINI